MRFQPRTSSANVKTSSALAVCRSLIASGSVLCLAVKKVSLIPPVTAFHLSARAQDFVRQFEAADQAVATELLRNLRLVSQEEITAGLRELILERARRGDGPVGLYAERELRQRLGRPHRIFEQPRSGVARAEGSGPLAVSPLRRYDQDVGSEGPIAQVIAQLCRQHRSLFISHPGPDQIRAKKVRRFFLVTDLVGSGTRAWKYIEAAWRVRSVRSWWSFGYLRFEVIAFSATQKGTARIESHNSRPNVYCQVPCPTIQNTFSEPMSAAVSELCINYDPKGRDPVESLGYDGTGALLIFANGAPNNVPRLLFATNRSRDWTPLFPQRVAADIPAEHFGRRFSAEEIERRLTQMRQRVLASSPAISRASLSTQQFLLLLAATTRAPRTVESIARRSGLTVTEVNQLGARLRQFHWLTPEWRPTDAGLRQLEHARNVARQLQRRRRTARPDDDHEYYPQSLRAPVTGI